MNNYPYFSRNGEILPTDQASVPLNNLEYAYGFGVYENIRVAKSKVLFTEDHCARLMESARIIGLEHSFTSEKIQAATQALVDKNQIETCNIKILLIGGTTKEAANLCILCLNPFFPDRKLYKTGAHSITYNYERLFPRAKTLNMLPSYLAYREAKKQNAYDAVLVNRRGNITEGTRTNFFAIQHRTIVSPPSNEILLGVTRDHVLQAAQDQDFEIVERDIPLTSLDQYDITFLTSTSSKIMPLRSINDQVWPEIPPALRELMRTFEERYHS